MKQQFTRLGLRLLFIVLALALLPAAQCMPDRVFVEGVEGYTEVILPEYEKYIQNDEDLSDTDKEIRIDSATGLRAIIKQAKEKK